MFTFCEAALVRRYRPFRYCFFVVSDVRLSSDAGQVASGEVTALVSSNPRRVPATGEDADVAMRACLFEIAPLA